MSLNLYWEPVKPVEPHYLGGHPLKGIICQVFGQHDGSLREEIILTEANLTELSVVSKLEGHDREVNDGIRQIVQAIQEHKTIRLWTDQ